MTCLLPRGNKKLNKKMKTKKGSKKINKRSKRSKRGSKSTKIHKKNLSKKISTISSDIGKTDKTCNDNTINCQKTKLLEILRETKFPFNQSRKNVMKKFDVEKMCYSTFTEYQKLIKSNA